MKAIDKIQKNIKNGRSSYKIGSYNVEWGVIDTECPYCNNKEKNDCEICNGIGKLKSRYIFSLIHLGTKTCTIKTYIKNEKDQKPELSYGTEVIYLGGWGSYTDVNSINEFLNIFKVNGYVNSKMKFFFDKKVYDFSDLKNPNINESLKYITLNYLKNVKYLIGGNRTIPYKQIVELVEEKQHKIKLREAARQL